MGLAPAPGAPSSSRWASCEGTRPASGISTGGHCHHRARSFLSSACPTSCGPRLSAGRGQAVSGPSLALVQLLAGEVPSQKPAARWPGATGDISPEAGWAGPPVRRGERAAGTGFRAWAGVRSPPLRGTFQAGRTDRPRKSPSVPLGAAPEEAAALELVPVPRESGASGAFVQPEAEGPGGRSLRCAGLRAECGPPPPCLHQSRAQAEGPPTASCCGPRPSPPQPQAASSSPAVWPRWPHPLQPPILRAWSRMGKQLAWPPLRCPPAARDAGPKKKPLPQRSQVSPEAPPPAPKLAQTSGRAPGVRVPWGRRPPWGQTYLGRGCSGGRRTETPWSLLAACWGEAGRPLLRLLALWSGLPAKLVLQLFFLRPWFPGMWPWLEGIPGRDGPVTAELATAPAVQPSVPEPGSVPAWPWAVSAHPQCLLLLP